MVRAIHPDGTLNKKVNNILFTIKTTWNFLPTSYQMFINIEAQKGIAVVPSLPRVGYHMELASQLTHARYRGYGPHACYSDRQMSTYDGIHDLNVDTCHVPYVVPSENGGRCNCKWISMYDRYVLIFTLQSEESVHRVHGSTVVLISITPPCFKLVSSYLSRIFSIQNTQTSLFLT